MFDPESLNNRVYSKRSLHGQLAHEIGLRIMRGEYQPDSFLPNEELFSAQLKVSRTAYREAMKVLTAKGLIESRPKMGTRIRPREEWNLLDPDLLTWSFEMGPDIDFMRSLFEMRIIFEPQCAELAAQRADQINLDAIIDAMQRMKSSEPDTRANVQADLDFHQGILAATGNDLLISLGHLIGSALHQSFRLSTHDSRARAVSIPMHQDVHDAIIKGHAAKARNAMDVLVRTAWTDMEGVMALQSAKAVS